ncbi:Hypothetical protein DHA2_153308 [Giardia duodenalis]|uniref:Uncharacterized protein n=1 Tax=Giardia intestinalis TaxID=5741 RepID=V6TF77_GIAIN|nr:Hypothetical protein DHA2_153308 [Giardia intestinalis]
MMRKAKGSNVKGSKTGAVMNFDESIDRLPTEQGFSLYSTKAEQSYRETPRRGSSSLVKGSQSVFCSSVYSVDERPTTRDRLSTDRFRAVHTQRNSTARESCFDPLPRVEYVDLNGKLLDPDKLRNSNLLPGQNNTRAVSQRVFSDSAPYQSPSLYASPLLESKQTSERERSPRPSLPVYALEEPYSQRTYREELAYAGNISHDIQEKYAVLPSEFTQVKTLFIPVSSSRQQSSYDQQQCHRTSPASPIRSPMHDTYEDSADLPTSYRIVERRGRTLINDLLLDPVTGMPAPVQMANQNL